MGALEHKFWRAACEVFGRADWTDRHWQRGALRSTPDMALRDEVAALVASQPLAVWAERFAEADACVTPVLTLAEAEDHPLFAGDAGAQPWHAVPGGLTRRYGPLHIHPFRGVPAQPHLLDSLANEFHPGTP